jgi:uncharacterized protein (TIGR02118 family)
MIRVSVMYPNAQGRRFDWTYYLENHMVAVRKLLDTCNARAEVDRGIGTAQPGALAPFVAVCHMYYKNMEDLQKVMAQAGEMNNDIPNFTDATPQIQISEIV